MGIRANWGRHQAAYEAGMQTAHEDWTHRLRRPVSPALLHDRLRQAGLVGEAAAAFADGYLETSERRERRITAKARKLPRDLLTDRMGWNEGDFKLAGS